MIYCLLFYVIMAFLAYLHVVATMEGDSFGWKGELILAVFWPITVFVLILAKGNKP